jgi:hypothetical protein
MPCEIPRSFTALFLAVVKDVMAGDTREDHFAQEVYARAIIGAERFRALCHHQIIMTPEPHLSATVVYRVGMAGP